jgi:hypothetical protein
MGRRRTLSNPSKGLLLILGLAVLFWIIIPIVLYLTLGIGAVEVFLVVNVIAMVAAVIFADRF